MTNRAATKKNCTNIQQLIIQAFVIDRLRDGRRRQMFADPDALRVMLPELNPGTFYGWLTASVWWLLYSSKIENLMASFNGSTNGQSCGWRGDGGWAVEESWAGHQARVAMASPGVQCCPIMHSIYNS